MGRIEEIVKLRSEFETIYDKYLSDGNNIDELKKIVEKIEYEEKLLNLESGFSAAQMKIHDFYIRIPTAEEKIGSIDNTDASRLISSTNDILEAIQPNSTNSVEYNLVGIGPGSTILMYDIIEKESLLKRYTKDETKEKITSVFKNFSEIKSGKFNKEKMESFKKTTGLDEKQIYEITKTIVKLTPTNDDEIQRIEFGINNENDI